MTQKCTASVLGRHTGLQLTMTYSCQLSALSSSACAGLGSSGCNLWARECRGALLGSSVLVCLPWDGCPGVSVTCLWGWRPDFASSRFLVSVNSVKHRNMLVALRPRICAFLCSSTSGVEWCQLVVLIGGIDRL